MSNTKKRMWISLLLFFISFLTYLTAIAPTVSLWDCGEFIACANILGIPHPPGTPFYMIIGRFFIIVLGFLDEIALRINIFSILTSALGISCAFLFIEKFLTLVLGSRQFFFAAVGGVIGSLLLTFSDTYWFNAVEAEVYGVSMLFVLFISWLGLLWYESKENPVSKRYLILICYLSFLGVGFHLYSMMIIPSVFLLMLLADKEMRTNWQLWITGVLLLSVVYNIENFLPISCITLISCIILRSFVSSVLFKKRITLCFWFSLFALIGFSTYAYIPIRSELNPRIDENNPEIQNVFKQADWGKFNNFISRKQYTSTGMFERSIHRRGLLANQLFSHPHMGYGGYMLAQYFPWKVGSGASVKNGNQYVFNVQKNEEGVKRFGKKFQTQMEWMTPYTSGRFLQILFFILFHIPMLWGVVFLYRSKKKNLKILATYAFVLYFIASIGLIFYMNFADGTQIELSPYQQWIQSGGALENKPAPVRMEVRERDYFYAPAYVFMSLLFGISAGLFLYKRKRRKPKYIGMIAFMLIILSVAIPFFSNYREHNRSNNYLAYDYARNLLSSCLPNSILFTNGDNDTFPLWFMQEVEKFRQDVRVINLSLGNTNWYIEQLLTSEPKVKLGYSRAQIQALTPRRNPLEEDRVIALSSNVEAVILSKQKKPYFRIQDLILISIVKHNFPDRPIHFVSSIGKSNMMGLDRYTQNEGMLYTLTSQRLEEKVNLKRVQDLLDSYAFRGLSKEDNVYYNGDNLTIMYSYVSVFRALLSGVRQEIILLNNNETKESKNKILALKKKSQEYIEKGLKYLYNNLYFYSVINEYYSSLEEFGELEKVLSIAIKSMENESIYFWKLVVFLRQEKWNEVYQISSEFESKFPRSRYLREVQQQKKKAKQKLEN